MNVIFTCGGTAGHVEPGAGAGGLYAGAASGSAGAVRGNAPWHGAGAHRKGGVRLPLHRGLQFSAVPVPVGHRPQREKALKNLALAGSRARAILRDFRPDLVVGTGGYASYPTVKYAAKEGIPTAVHESNMVPGLTTKMLEGYAGCIMVGFEECRQHYKHPEKIVVTGTPVRGDFFHQTKEQARQKLGLTDDRTAGRLLLGQSRRTIHERAYAGLLPLGGEGRNALSPHPRRRQGQLGYHAPDAGGRAADEDTGTGCPGVYLRHGGCHACGGSGDLPGGEPPPSAS